MDGLHNSSEVTPVLIVVTWRLDLHFYLQLADQVWPLCSRLTTSYYWHAGGLRFTTARKCIALRSSCLSLTVKDGRSAHLLELEANCTAGGAEHLTVVSVAFAARRGKQLIRIILISFQEFVCMIEIIGETRFQIMRFRITKGCTVPESSHVRKFETELLRHFAAIYYSILQKVKVLLKYSRNILFLSIYSYAWRHNRMSQGGRFGRQRS